MRKVTDKKKLFMIVSICILCITLIGGTLAYYRTVLFADLNVGTITHGLDYYITYIGGQNIDSATLERVSDYTQTTSSTEITFYKNDNTYDIYGYIYLDIKSIGDITSQSSALKYTVVNSTTGAKLSEGTLAGSKTNDSVLIASNIPLQTTEELFKIYIWIDENETVDPAMEGETLSLTVRCEATMKKLVTRLVDHLTNLYLDNKDTDLVENNDILYRYASIYDKDNDETTSGGLMNDRHGSMDTEEDDGNIRYYGANPNNYIYFNCNNYNNQSITDTEGKPNCELWRIIGVFDGKVKIMRNGSIGDLAWDQDKNQNSSLTTFNNDWSTSSLQEFLNGKYYDRGEEITYTYYTEWDGSSTGSINLENIGIKNDTTRGLISETLWYLKGWDSSSIYSDQMYDYERNSGNVAVTEQPTTMPGNIAIPYASDYGYAVDFGSCSETLYYYDNTACTSENWMKPILGTSTFGWLMAPYSSRSVYAWYVRSSGRVHNDDIVYSANSVAPVLHLNSELGIKTGDGTQNSPYKLAVS